jgi:hypothetical protein
MLLLGTINTTDQAVAVDGLVNFGSVYRRYDKKGKCGCRAFEVNGTSILLQSAGIYHLTAVLDTEADTTFQLFENNVANPNAITTTGVLDVYILVDSSCVLNAVSSLKSISIVNTQTATTVTNVVVNIDKVV